MNTIATHRGAEIAVPIFSPPPNASSIDASVRHVVRPKKRNVLPGFGLSLGITLSYLSLIVLIPLAALLTKTATLSFDSFIAAVFSPRVVATYLVSFGAALAAAVTNVIFGAILAWTLVRYRFPGRKLVDSLIDLPFALPTAVAGIALTAIYAKNGWLGDPLEALGLKVAFTPIGVYVAMVFIGLPFVVRTLQPVLEDHEIEFEEAAASLGATRLRTILTVIAPAIFPALLTGFALAFARAVGEYGSIIFIAGNIPYVSEITPLIIITKLEQYDYAGATAVATVMLAISFALLLAINVLQAWTARCSGRTA
jgi:sulfate/thiosulfate transport system permease protein